MISLKKAACAIAAVTFALAITGCSSPEQSSDSTSEPTNTQATQQKSETPRSTPTPDKPAVTYTARSIAEELAATVGGDTVIDMAADLIGGTEGASFMFNGSKFEIYKFDDQAKIDEAKTGTLTVAIEGFGDVGMPSEVNSSYVLVYQTKNDAVSAAFGALTL